MCNAPRNAPRSPTPAQTISPAASDDELLSSDEFADFPEATDRLLRSLPCRASRRRSCAWMPP